MTDAFAIMPPEAPLAHPVQSLRDAHRDGAAPEMPGGHAAGWRAVVFIGAMAMTGALVGAFLGWLDRDGLHWLELVLIALVGITFFWIALAFSTALAGIARFFLASSIPDAPGARLDVALLVPIYEEVPWDVMGNAAAMMADLEPGHDYTLYVLSDTRDPGTAAAEEAAFAQMRLALPAGARAFYRRRLTNTERKTGNLADWTRRWGGAHDAMVVLDADSLMTGAAIARLAGALAADPAAGLIQSAPRLIGARTFFARVQQFSHAVTGALLAEGLAGWTDREGNYWGHNAIIRTRAFAACAGLPKMPSLRGEGGLILSHDFVEAGMLRRAGWAVRFLPRIEGSYEEAPATLIDYAIRDRRWCHGNLQHLMLLRTRGFHAVSRFHLFSGAMAYLLSPLWFVLLVIWALLGNGEQSVINYFSEENPLYPMWPEMTGPWGASILAFMYGTLLAPKIMGLAALPLTGLTAQRMGGWGRLTSNTVLEIAASVMIAPVMMVQQLVAVGRTALGMGSGWAPQARAGGRYSLPTVAKFHALETAIGALLVIGMAMGLVSWWLAPIAASLFLAIPMSALSGFDMESRSYTRGALATPEVIETPAIWSTALAQRARIKEAIEARVAAE